MHLNTSNMASSIYNRRLTTYSWILAASVALSCHIAFAQESNMLPADTANTFQTHNGPYVTSDPNFLAVIAVRPDVQAAVCSEIPVIISLNQIGNTGFPQTVTVHSDHVLEYQNQVDRHVDIPANVGFVTLFLKTEDEGYRQTIPAYIWVTLSDNWNDTLSKLTKVEVTGQGFQMTVVQAPKTLPADGVTAGTIIVKFTSYSGKTLPNTPCIITWSGAETDRQGMAAAASDNEGLVKFTVPPSARPGPGAVNFVSEQNSNIQIVVNYVAPPANGNPTGSQLKPATTGN